jgi:hypothetical protein
VQAYSPYTGTSWKHEWRESKSGDFPGQFLSIVKALQQEASNIVNLVEENERQAIIRHDEWEIQQQKSCREEDEKNESRILKIVKRSSLASLRPGLILNELMSFLRTRSFVHKIYLKMTVKLLSIV